MFQLQSSTFVVFHKVNIIAADISEYLTWTIWTSRISWQLNEKTCIQNFQLIQMFFDGFKSANNLCYISYLNKKFSKTISQVDLKLQREVEFVLINLYAERKNDRK